MAGVEISDHETLSHAPGSKLSYGGCFHKKRMSVWIFGSAI